MNIRTAAAALGAIGLIAMLGACSNLSSQYAQQKGGGEDETGPYDVVANWPQPLHTDGWSWGSTAGVWAETPAYRPCTADDAASCLEAAVLEVDRVNIY